ncbi:MAG: hypothetical protein ACOCQR_01460 [bacterium]
MERKIDKKILLITFILCFFIVPAMCYFISHSPELDYIRQMRLLEKQLVKEAELCEKKMIDYGMLKKEYANIFKKQSSKKRFSFDDFENNIKYFSEKNNVFNLEIDYFQQEEDLIYIITFMTQYFNLISFMKNIEDMQYDIVFEAIYIQTGYEDLETRIELKVKNVV